MPPKMHIKNDRELVQAFKRLDKLSQKRNLEIAALAGIQPINNDAIEYAPVLTGTFRRSIHAEITESRDLYVEAASGTDIEYAKRLEFGFTGRDSLGREYHQPARPTFRPAFDRQRRNAVAETADALKDILRKLV